MKARALNEITQSCLQEFFSYDELTGILLWKTPISKRPKSNDRSGSIEPNGYRRVTVTINSKQYRFLEHRAIWLMYYGFWPKVYIDHINGNRSDNRINNLREANNSQNMRNQPAKSKSGIKGVYKSGNGYRARFWLDGRNKHLGWFSNKEDANFAYQSEATKYFGEFCNFKRIGI